MEDGNNDEPELVDYTDEFGTPTGEQYLLKGTERGGHFTYNKNDESNTVDILGYELANFLPGTTSLNSGDFPFTFHTHPITVKDDIEVDTPHTIYPEAPPLKIFLWPSGVVGG